MKCKYCNENEAIKYSKYSNGEFCSKKCAKGYSTKNKRKEINEKVSEKLKGTVVTATRIKNPWTDEQLDTWKQKIQETYNNKILDADFNSLSFGRLRKRVILEQKSKCNNCGLDEWLGEPLTLELEHKDGNNKNNKRENLEAICPNCHSLTKTWRGRNKNSKRLKVDDETLLRELIKTDWNMRQSLLSVGLAAKGGNYKRCHKLKKEYMHL